MKKSLFLLLLFVPIIYGMTAPDSICFELKNGTACIVPNNETGDIAFMTMGGGGFVFDSDVAIKGDLLTDVEADTGFKVGSGTPQSISFDGEDAYIKDEFEVGGLSYFKNTIQADIGLNTTNITANYMIADYFLGDGTGITGIMDYDNGSIIRNFNTSWVSENQAYWNSTDVSFLNILSTTIGSVTSWITDFFATNIYSHYINATFSICIHKYKN